MLGLRTSAASRRIVLQSGFGLGGSLLLGCASEPLNEPQSDTPQNKPEGELLGIVPFVGESDVSLEEPFNAGLDGRLYTDLSLLDEGHLTTPSEAFYVRTRYPDLLQPESRWPIDVWVDGETSLTIFLDEIAALATAQGAHLMECSGNARGASFGLMSSADWTGVPLLRVLDRFDRGDATGVLVSGFDEHSQQSLNNHSTPGASWVFSFDDLQRTGAFLATQMNGDALLADHGAPVRLVVPGWYGCTCIKWVNEIRLVGTNEPATSQMIEFASRTHQSGAPTLARDYRPAEIDVAAMPVRVEKWLINGVLRYRAVGIEWGGVTSAFSLEIRIGDDDWTAVQKRASAASAASWRLWEHSFAVDAPGTYAITLRVPGDLIRTRRLDTGYYRREISVAQG